MAQSFFGEAGPPASPSAFERGAPTVDELLLRAISATEWRVCDKRMPSSDPRGLLGFITKRPMRRKDRFAAMRLGGGLEWREFGSLAAAKAHFTDAAEHPDATDDTRPETTPGSTP